MMNVIKIHIFGENSKIGKSIIQHLPNHIKIVSFDERPDYIFLCTSAEKSKQLFNQYCNDYRIVDFSSAFKHDAILQTSNITYAFNGFFNNQIPHIVFTGCSSLAIMQAILPIQKYIKKNSIFADVKFSKTAMQNKSHNQEMVLQNKIEIVNPFNHYHEKEINMALPDLGLKIVPSVLDFESGLFVNIYFNINKNVNIKNEIEHYYLHSSNIVFEKSINDVINTNLTSLSIYQDNKRCCISVVTDNLINGKIWNYISLNQKILHEPLQKYSRGEFGKFGVIRKYDIHTGIDLYCENNDHVYAMESGIVKKNQPFTGTDVGSPWWENTNYVGVLGDSGYIVYGEITSDLKEGSLVNKGDIIGNVKQVLKTNKGKPQSMLHLEYYKNYIEDPIVWNLNAEKHQDLLNPESLFFFIQRK